MKFTKIKSLPLLQKYLQLEKKTTVYEINKIWWNMDTIVLYKFNYLRANYGKSL